MSITALCVLAKPWEAEWPSAGTVQVNCGSEPTYLPTWATAPGLHCWNTVRTRPVAPLPGTSPVQPAQTAWSLAPPHCSSKSSRAP